MICQWGSGQFSDGGDHKITLPISFTANNYGIAIARQTNAGTTTHALYWIREQRSNASFNLYSTYVPLGFMWIAIGY